MAILPVNIARVANLTRQNVALDQLQVNEAAMLKVQNELTTGRKLNTPSQNPGDAAIAQQIRKTLEQRDAFSANLSAAKDTLGSVDSTLGDITGLINQSQTLASANVGDDVSQSERDAAATQVDSIYSQLVDLANKSFEGSYLFGGDKLDQPPFKTFAGGVQFVGSDKTLRNQVDESTDASFQVNGADVWGALSTRIESKAAITPSVSAGTRLVDLGGASGTAVPSGFITINDGTDTAKIDLTHADTLGDVIDAVNGAGLGSVTAAINAAGTGLTISGGAGESLTVTDVGGGTVASALGIRTATSPGAGLPVVGTSTHPKISPVTPLSALNGGAGLDPTGLKITNGTKTATVSLSGATTVQDLLNAVNGSDTGVQMSINDDGTGVRLLNTTQGTNLSVSEAGGTTAADLGLRSFTAASPLAELNGGDGVRTVDGPDFSITDSTGAKADIDLGPGDKTTQDVIDKINAGGIGVTAGFATTGNGIVLTDTAGGAGKPKVTSTNGAPAAKDLGLDVDAVGGVITGRDVNPVVAKGVFANLAALRDAMRSGDQAAITKASENIAGDYDRVVRVHGDIGARVQAVESRQDRLADENVSTNALLSQLEDTDFTEAASQYSLLQTSLEATMRTTSTMLNLSLMDFLK